MNGREPGEVLKQLFLRLDAFKVLLALEPGDIVPAGQEGFAQKRAVRRQHEEMRQERGIFPIPGDILRARRPQAVQKSASAFR